MSGLPLIGSDEPWSGGSFSPTVTCVLAPNPSPMTLDGTNTWLVGAPGGPIVVIDPGPDDQAHLSAIVETTGNSSLLGLSQRGSKLSRKRDDQNSHVLGAVPDCPLPLDELMTIC